MELHEAIELFREAHRLMSEAWTERPTDASGFPVDAGTDKSSGRDTIVTEKNVLNKNFGKVTHTDDEPKVDEYDARHDPSMAGSNTYDQMTPIEQQVFDSQVRNDPETCVHRWKKGMNQKGMIRTCLLCLKSEAVNNDTWKNTAA